MDSKCLSCKNNIDIEYLNNHYYNDNNKILFWKHPNRSTCKEEIDITIALGLENVNNAVKFKNKIKDFSSPIPLPDTCYIIRSTDIQTTNLFSHVYHFLKLYGLKRDQNIINYAIYDYKYNINCIKFLTTLP